jgi:hypothetical protein
VSYRRSAISFAPYGSGAEPVLGGFLFVRWVAVGMQYIGRRLRYAAS